MPAVEWCRVFAGCADGGIAVPIVLDADDRTTLAMRLGAAAFGYATGYHMRAPPGSNCDFALRCWTEKGEIAFCSQAILAAVWLLDDLGRLPRDRLSIWTPFGEVRAAVTERSKIGADVEVFRPHVRAEPLGGEDERAVLDALRLNRDDRLAPGPLRLVRLDRAITLVGLKDLSILADVACDRDKIDALSHEPESTLICPYARNPAEALHYMARVFPSRPTRWREATADGSAALALAMVLVSDGVVPPDGKKIFILQGLELYRGSELFVTAHVGRDEELGYWLHGMAGRQDPSWLDDETDFNLDVDFDPD